LTADPRWISLYLLGSVRAIFLYIDTLLLPAAEPGLIYFGKIFRNEKIAALDFVPDNVIFSFFLLNQPSGRDDRGGYMKIFHGDKL